MYIFEDASDLRTWLSSELHVLGGVAPLSLLGTSLGRHHVQELLHRLEWGIYSYLKVALCWFTGLETLNGFAT